MVCDFLVNLIDPLHVWPKPCWLYTDFTDSSRIVHGAETNLSPAAFRGAVKQLLAWDMAENVVFPLGAEQLHHRPNKFIVIYEWLVFGPQGPLVVTVAPTRQPRVDLSTVPAA